MSKGANTMEGLSRTIAVAGSTEGSFEADVNGAQPGFIGTGREELVSITHE